MKFRLLEKVSFRASTKTLYADLLKAHPRPKLADDEVVVFLSQSGDNMRWVYGYMDLGEGAVILRSRELRLMKGEWDILKLKKYAAMAHMKITDWSVFEKALARAHKAITTGAKS